MNVDVKLRRVDHVSGSTMANSLVVHGAVFAVGALVGSGIAVIVARKDRSTSSQNVTPTQQSAVPVLQVGTTGRAVITPNVGIMSPPLKYGNPGMQSPPLCQGCFPTPVTRTNCRPTRPQSLCSWLRSSIEAPRLGVSCSLSPQTLF